MDKIIVQLLWSENYSLLLLYRITSSDLLQYNILYQTYTCIVSKTAFHIWKDKFNK